MSVSPPIRRLSTGSATKEELINAYEAEEERITNVLYKRLEQLKEEKIELENTLEAESESHVNRLTRELAALRADRQQPSSSALPLSPADPSTDAMIATLQRENEMLRSRLADMERENVHSSRLSEVYREELIEHRTRLGLPVDHLVSPADPFSEPTHQRPPSATSSAFSSSTSSPTNSVFRYSRPSNGVPIPRPASQFRRQDSHDTSDVSTPLSHSPSSASDVFSGFSSSSSANAVSASFASVNSALTSPPTSFNPNAVTFAVPSRGLTYPSVPPPSLSSSFGSPTVSYHMQQHRDPLHSPVEPPSRRSSVRRGARVVESGSLRGTSRSLSQGRSVERGGRVAETGQLVPRSHAEGHTLASTTEVDGIEVDGIDE
ncbi:unnamed protein product [Mycena citricolor]|uniref:Uncharacterized protein n=1 Tax=Mycena citricolor TaxID=2018698 RepID=A0AAD2HBS3_9AGAR|nr:unnamed protein product [Mycena citricolor]CAK5272803.1 unnamed protein product [Mycena citricolor]